MGLSPNVLGVTEFDIDLGFILRYCHCSETIVTIGKTIDVSLLPLLNECNGVFFVNNRK